jgi:spore photoproduct lyase
MDEEKRKYKWGRYGIGKYVYPTEEANELETTIRQYINEYFPNAVVEYFT